MVYVYDKIDYGRSHQTLLTQKLIGLREACLLSPLPLGLSRETLPRTSSKVLYYSSPLFTLFHMHQIAKCITAQLLLATPAPAAPLQSSLLTTWSPLLLINFAKFFRFVYRQL